MELLTDNFVEESTRFPKIYNPFKRSEDGRCVEVGKWARDEFEILADSQWTGTEKMDGTNVRIVWEPRTDALFIMGRGPNTQMHPDLKASLVNTFMEDGRWHAAFEKDLLAEADVWVVLYGEGIGPGIQKGGGMYCGSKDFCLFDVRVGGRSGLWLKQDDVTEVAQKMALMRAPILGVATLKQWMLYASQEGFKTKLPGADPNKQAEGVMCRPQGNFLTRRGERIICKVKTNQLPPRSALRWLGWE